MATRHRASRGKRGHVSMGGGRVGRHRKRGSSGGRGYTGMLTHHRTWVTRYHPFLLGKKGMRKFKLKKSTVYNKTIEVGQLWGQLSHDALETAQKHGNKRPVEFNLADLGFHRLLGGGSLPKYPIHVKCAHFTKEAEAKIKAIGGTCELYA